MRQRITAIAVLAVLLGAITAAQSPSELLQKGIYTQETLGDVDGAIRIYQQVVAAANQAAEVKAQAERRLRTLQTQRRVPTPSTAVIELVPPAREAEARGFTDGKMYRHRWTGLTIGVPDGWGISDTFSSSDDGEMVMFESTDPPAMVNVWMKKEENDRDAVRQKLENAPIQKAGQRIEFEGWRIRDGATQRVYIGGHQAVVAIADFTESGQKMSEYLTWIYTEHARVFFFSRLPARDLDRLRPQFDQLVASAVIP